MLYLPTRITATLAEFSERIGCDYPVLIPCQPDYQGRVWSCHTNVKTRVAEQQGRQIFGYYFIKQFFNYQAIFHSVWESPEGELEDITPFPDLRNQNMFGALKDQELMQYHHPIYFSSVFGLAE
jgi:hypothetical protein